MLGDQGGPHRLWLPGPSIQQPLAYTIVADAWTKRRLRAVQRLHQSLGGGSPSGARAPAHPSPFQRQRLSLLLDILDDIQAPGGKPFTAHQIATRRIYPAMTLGPGAAWKASSERRRTQRLIDEAMAMMEGGYRALLRG